MFSMQLAATLAASVCMVSLASGCGAQPAGAPVLPPDALLTTPVGGLEATRARAEIVPVAGQGFAKALRVTIGAASAETNATQLTMQTAAPVRRGDALFATLYVRGASADGKSPGRIEFLFERAVSPWTKSVSQGVTTPRNPENWKRVSIGFLAAESTSPGESMVSLRFAFGPQTIEVGGLEVRNVGPGLSPDDLADVVARGDPLGSARASVRLVETRQTLVGFGGDFCQPRYGRTEAMDAVGAYNLAHLRVAHARIGIPLDWWTPEKGVYKDDAQARASFLAMQEMARRKIPFVASIWEGPQWMLGGRREQSGRTLPPEHVDDCIEAIAQYLITARDRYGVVVEYISFNEPDYGVNFRFTAPQMAAFIRRAGARFAQLRLKTRFLVGDTASGAPSAEYSEALLADPTIAPYLGPIAFHCWDVLSAPDASYEAIAKVGAKHRKPIWCTEAGHDAGLWQQPDPWESWENAIRTALAYEKTLRLSGAEIMDYWTYQDNYPIVSRDGSRPFRVHHVLRQMEDVFPRGSKVACASVDKDALRVLPTVGPKPGQFAALLVNPSGAGRVTLTGLPAGAVVSVVTSTRTEQRKAGPPTRTDARGRIEIDLPARSVVTLLSGATEESRHVQP